MHYSGSTSNAPMESLSAPSSATCDHSERREFKKRLLSRFLESTHSTTANSLKGTVDKKVSSHLCEPPRMISADLTDLVTETDVNDNILSDSNTYTQGVQSISQEAGHVFQDTCTRNQKVTLFLSDHAAPQQVAQTNQASNQASGSGTQRRTVTKRSADTQSQSGDPGIPALKKTVRTVTNPHEDFPRMTTNLPPFTITSGTDNLSTRRGTNEQNMNFPSMLTDLPSYSTNLMTSMTNNPSTSGGVGQYADFPRIMTDLTDDMVGSWPSNYTNPPIYPMVVPYFPSYPMVPETNYPITTAGASNNAHTGEWLNNRSAKFS